MEKIVDVCKIKTDVSAVIKVALIIDPGEFGYKGKKSKKIFHILIIFLLEIVLYYCLHSLHVFKQTNYTNIQYILDFDIYHEEYLKYIFNCISM